ncbi:MAG: hypothetical protein JSV91_05995 [Phycisphaerales bacterium]|nr:MAG: hypothetical protein JSV91_05995 [Phycisphaerales bacterium]
MNRTASGSASPHPAERPRRRSKARLIIPVAVAGLTVGLVTTVFRNAEPSMTVSEVRRAIRQIALRQSDRTEQRQGGSIGPWWVAADDCADPLAGEFVNFRLSSGNMQIAAKRAMLHVDPRADTIRFEMWNVVFARAPYTMRNQQSADHFLHRMDHYVLGPAPWEGDIIPDAGNGAEGDGTLPLVDATTESE